MVHDTPSDDEAFSGPRRFVDSAADRFAQYLTAAQDYPTMLTPDEANGLFRKPFGVLTPDEAAEPHPKPYGVRSRTYLALAMSQVLAVIEQLALTPGALVIDAGAGSGWLSEILLGLGYRVRMVEPSPAMVAAARDRMALFERKYHIPVIENVAFITSSLEELPAPATDAERADAIFFFESFHHVIDESRAARQAFTQLRDGRYLAICGESRWLPGNAEQAEFWNREMERYGTLESPFTRDYLLHVLEQAGFIDVQFFHTVNQLVPIQDEGKPVRDVAGHGSADFLNTVIARRPIWHGPGIAENRDMTAAAIVIRQVRRPQPGILEIAVTLENAGSTMWPDNPMTRGWVAIALFGKRAYGSSAEARNRERLPRPVLPGENIELSCRFFAGDLDAPFHVRLVANDCFWFNESAAIPA